MTNGASRNTKPSRLSTVRATAEFSRLAAGGEGHFQAALYISFVILHTEQTGRSENKFTAHGYSRPPIVAQLIVHSS